MISSLVQFVFVIFALVLGAALEELLPEVLGVGVPVLMASATFMALHRSESLGLSFAVLAGAVEDTLSALPPMTSVSYFLAAALLARFLGRTGILMALAYPLYQIWLAVWLPGIGGGVFALGVCVLGWFLYSSWSEMGELEENLQMQDEAFRKHNAAPIFPSKKAIEAVKSNEVSFVEWGEKARVVAAGGDKAFPGESPSQFKQRLQNEVQRLAALPGGAAGKIAGAEFKFGFQQFLKDGGALPKSTEVERLAVQLDTISTVVDLFAESGVLEVKSIVRVEPKQDDEDDDQDRRKKAKKGKK